MLCCSSVPSSDKIDQSQYIQPQRESPGWPLAVIGPEWRLRHSGDLLQITCQLWFVWHLSSFTFVGAISWSAPPGRVLSSITLFLQVPATLQSRTFLHHPTPPQLVHHTLILLLMMINTLHCLFRSETHLPVIANGWSGSCVLRRELILQIKLKSALWALSRGSHYKPQSNGACDAACLIYATKHFEISLQHWQHPLLVRDVTQYYWWVSGRHTAKHKMYLDTLYQIYVKCSLSKNIMFQYHPGLISQFYCDMNEH